jgi:hypothetical protein
MSAPHGSSFRLGAVTSARRFAPRTAEGLRRPRGRAYVGDASPSPAALPRRRHPGER